MQKFDDYFDGISPLALGTNTFGWTADTRTSHAILDTYVNAGGNFIDTADCYPQWADSCHGGESEEVLGLWLARGDNRDKVYVSTKVGAWEKLGKSLTPHTIKQGCAGSLKRLQIERIDLYWAHFDDKNTPLEDTVQAFAELQTAGDIAHIGLSNYSPERIEEWFSVADELGVERPIALQPHYNLVFRKDFEAERRGIVEKYELGVFPYFSLAAGFLTGKYRVLEDIAGERASMALEYASDKAFYVVHQLITTAASYGISPAAMALKWLASQQTVTAPLASARNTHQLQQMMDGLDVNVSASDIAALTRISQGL
ncbi:MAG: aldo/keto reductase [Actinomycetaceae bacterium]|nr:aldo/keto reductase [Actinomycetaceae bacterium]